jgi:hypothetical protein
VHVGHGGCTAYPEISLLCRIREPDGDSAAGVPPAANHPSMQTFDNFLRGSSAFQSKPNKAISKVPNTCKAGGAKNLALATSHTSQKR